MGLRPMAAGGWLEPDGYRARDLAQKARLLAERRDDVLALGPDRDGRALAACRELLASVAAEQAPGAGAAGSAVGDAHPIEATARRTQEDWCVHVPDDSGRWRLAAACVCFPTRWVLADKIGRTVRDIHLPVPGYGERLADPVDAFLDRLRPGAEHGVWRLNWNLLDSPALFQPRRGAPPAAGICAEDAGERVWLRVERQTLVRLAATGAVVFGIRVHVDPLGSIAGDGDALGRLERSLRSLPRSTWDDKGLDALGGAVLDWIAAVR